MLQVLQNLNNGETLVQEVPALAASNSRLLINTSRTLISAGTEKMLVEFGQAGLIGKAKAQPEKVKQVIDKIRTDGLMPTLDAVFSRLGEPLPLGYCSAGIVTHVGNHLSGFEIGDRVVSNGSHSEIVSVPPLLAAKIPENVSDEQAAFTVLASIGLQGVRLIAPTLGETVVVYGLGLIGLVTVQLLRACGCRVVGIDINPQRLDLAATFGAEPIHGSECSDLPGRVCSMTNSRGADAVIITASAKSDSIVSSAAKMCRKRGRVVLVGVVGLNLNRADFYEKEISFQVSCSYGPGRYDQRYEQDGLDYPVGYVRWTEQRNFEAILLMLATGQLDFLPLISNRVGIEQAAQAYSIIQNDPSALGVILEYSGSPNPKQTIPVKQSSEIVPSRTVIAGIVGAGNFTRATLMPALKNLPMRRKYVVGRTNAAAIQHIAQKFNCENATTDFEHVLNDPELNLVFITTNHDSHARLICQSMQAGKHVFVEKPLALTLEELCEVASVAERHMELQLMVGFNRRFSPHIEKCKSLLSGRVEPLAMHMLVNAGEIPPDHWVHDPRVGGGRIIGEACHFIDLLVFLSGSKVKSVSAHRMGNSAAVRDDKMTITMELEDGSIGSINYFANGSKSFPKESLQVFSDGRILQIDNFRQTTGYGFRGFKKLKTSRQDKGHARQFAEIIDSVAKGQRLIPLDQLYNVTLASFAAVKAAQERSVVKLAKGFLGLETQ